MRGVVKEIRRHEWFIGIGVVLFVANVVCAFWPPVLFNAFVAAFVAVGVFARVKLLRRIKRTLNGGK